MGSDRAEPSEGAPAPSSAGGPPRGPGRTAHPVAPRWAAVALDDGPAAAAPAVAASAAEAVAASRVTSRLPLPPPPVVVRRAAGADRVVVVAVLAAVLLAASWALRLLSDWERGRWWMLEAVGLGLAGVLGIVGVAVAVGVLGEVRRSRGTRTGTISAAVGLGLAGLVVVGSGALGGHDWTALDVPAAWDRLELGMSGEEDEVVTGQAPEGPWLIREYVEVGDCFAGPTDRPREELECTAPHRTEVVGVVTLTPEGDDYPGEQALVEVTLPRCRDAVAARPRGAAVVDDVQVVIPSSRQWGDGDRKAACVLVADKAVTGSQVG